MRPSLPQRGQQANPSKILCLYCETSPDTIDMLRPHNLHGPAWRPLPSPTASPYLRRWGSLCEKRNVSPPFTGPGSLALQLELEERRATNNKAAAHFWGSDRRLSIQIPDVQAFSFSSFCSLQSWPLLRCPWLKVDLISVACNYKKPCPG
jgi:hypothetical protein